MKTKFGLLIVIGIIILASSVSAMDWDNLIDYEEDNKVAIFENALGLPLIGNTIAKVELITPKINYVVPGKDRRVMIFTIDNFGELYENGLKGIEILNMKTDLYEQKSFYYEYAIYEEVVVNDYIDICDYKNIDDTCKRSLSGSHVESQITSWERLNSNNIPKGNLTIALVTDVKEGDIYDGIPILFGKRVSKWAVWTDSFNTGLEGYWKFNDDSTLALDSVHGTNNITGLNSDDFGFTGKINTAYNVSGVYWNSTNLKSSYESMVWDGMTLNFWFNSTENFADVILSNAQLTERDGAFMLAETQSGDIDLVIQGNSSSDPITMSNGTRAYNFEEGEWVMITVILNKTSATLYGDSVVILEEASKTFNLQEFNITFFNKENGDNDGNGTNFIIDELGIWNRSLSISEISDLYNSGTGISYIASDEITVYNTLLSPLDNDQINGTDKIFSANYSSNRGNISNATLNLWYPNSSLFDINFSTDFSGVANTTNLTFSDIFIGNYDWNFEVCVESATGTLCDWAPANRSFSVGLDYNVSFNSTVLVDYVEGFAIDVTYNNTLYSDIVAILIYDNIEYTSTKSGTLDKVNFSTSQITTQGDKNFYWNISVFNGGSSFNFTTAQETQVIETPIFAACNTTFNEKFLNFSFEEENTGVVLEAAFDDFDITYWIGPAQSVNNTYSFSNSTENLNYDFCFEPSDKTVNNEYTLQYSKSGYIARRYAKSDALTNTTTNVVLYLLNSSSGIYSTYQVQDEVGGTISGVKVQVEREINSVWTLLEEATSDSAGAVTFWLDPNYDHRFSFTKATYASVQVTIRPSSSIYTVVMGKSSGDASYSSDVEGLKWITWPSPGRLDPDIIYNFGFNITSSLGNLIDCKMEIKNFTDIINTTVGYAPSGSCNSYGGNFTLTMDISTQQELWGVYSVDLGAGFIAIDADIKWRIHDIDKPSRGTLYDFLDRFDELSLFGDDTEGEFTRIVLVFFFMLLVLATISYSTGWDFATNGGLLPVFLPMIWIASITGLLILDGVSPFTQLDKYFVALVTTLLVVGYVLNDWRRMS